MTVNPQPLKLTANHSDSSKMSCGEHFQSFCEVTYLQLKHIQEAYQHNNIKKKKGIQKIDNLNFFHGINIKVIQKENVV